MVDSNAKGNRRERELVNLLYDNDWGVMRAPSSGSATERELPDVIAGNAEYFYVIEAKSSSGDPIYLTEEEVDALLFFAEKFGGYARVGARFDREKWTFFNPRALHRTPGDNYRVKQEDLPDGQTLEELATGPL